MSSERRALEAELAHLENKIVALGLWDIHKFFDSIDLPALLCEALAVAFPQSELGYSLVVHAAPRVLRHGKAHGDIIPRVGRSI